MRIPEPVKMISFDMRSYSFGKQTHGQTCTRADQQTVQDGQETTKTIKQTDEKAGQ